MKRLSNTLNNVDKELKEKAAAGGGIVYSE